MNDGALRYDEINMNYYQILGISQNATADEIRSAYKHMAKKHHPDMGGDSESFIRVQEAYETLSNMSKRQAYDSQLNSGASQRNYQSRHQRHNATAMNVVANCVVDVPYTKANDDFILKVHTADTICQRCPGRCFHCHGQGCSYCANSGVLEVGLPANCCRKNKTKSKENPYTISIKPRSICRDGDKRYIELNNGNSLVYEINISFPAGTSRDGSGNLLVTRNVSRSRLQLGTSVTIIDANAQKVRVKIPRHTASGRVFRLPGRGFDNADLYLTVKGC